MNHDRPQPSSEDVLRLIEVALNEFDSVSLDATVRRTIRIANLLGDSFAAVRLGLDLKPSGGHPPANAEMTRRLMDDPESWGAPDNVAERALDRYIAERGREDGLISSHAIEEILFWRDERLPADQIPDDQYGTDLSNQLKMIEILTRTRHHAFTLLCQWERQLTFTVNQGDALAAVSRRVDALLSSQSPDVLDMFNVAFRRLRDAVSRGSDVEASEELTQAAASCRRILKAVVDVVQPADPDKPESEGGHALTDEHYKNRLVEFLRGHVSSGSFRAALIKDGDSLFERFGSLDGLTSKGVHARVALDEAEFCALHTYLLAGEILVLTEVDEVDGGSAVSEPH